MGNNHFSTLAYCVIPGMGEKQHRNDRNSGGKASIEKCVVRALDNTGVPNQNVSYPSRPHHTRNADGGKADETGWMKRPFPTFSAWNNHQLDRAFMDHKQSKCKWT